MTGARSILFVLVMLMGLVAPFAARAQVMPTQGIPIPWFHSPAERIQRDACRRNLPECRASVRAQMDLEESITVILPWAALGIAILGVLFWLRKQEKVRERRKQLAKMHHTPGAFKKLDKPNEEKRDDDEEDRLAF